MPSRRSPGLPIVLPMRLQSGASGAGSDDAERIADAVADDGIGELEHPAPANISPTTQTWLQARRQHRERDTQREEQTLIAIPPDRVVAIILDRLRRRICCHESAVSARCNNA